MKPDRATAWKWALACATEHPERMGPLVAAATKMLEAEAAKLDTSQTNHTAQRGWAWQGRAGRYVESMTEKTVAGRKCECEGGKDGYSNAMS